MKSYINLHWFCTISLLVIVTLSVYWSGLNGPLMLDDGPQIVPILSDVNSDNWQDSYNNYIFSNSGQLGRPIAMATFILNAIIAGNDIWYWKLTNVFFHILTGCIIYFFSRLIITLDNDNNELNTNIAAIFITAVWILHPLQVSTVLYLVQRMTILSAFFTMAALACYLNGINNELNNKSGAISLILSVFLFLPLAVLSKENAALFPIYILLLTLYSTCVKKIKIFQLPQSVKIYNFLMILFILTGLFVLINYREILLFNGYKTKDFTIVERLLTESRVIIIYIKQIIFPHPSIMGFFHDDIIISKNLLNPLDTLISVSIIILLIYLSITNFKKNATPAFGLLFFFASHLFESTIFGLEIAFEHRNYIGIWGITLALSSFLKIINFNKYILFAICITLSSLTLYRSSIWSNSNKMYPYMLSIHPNSKRLSIIHADTYTSAQKFELALKYINDHNGIGFDLQRLYIRCNRDKKLSEGVFTDLIVKNHNIKIGIHEMEGIISIANLGLDNKCFFSKNGFLNFLSAITNLTTLKNIDLQKLYIYEAHYHHQLGNSNKSITALENSFLAYNNNPIPLFLMTEWLINDNKMNDAIMKFTMAKSVANKSIIDYSTYISNIYLILDNKSKK